MSWKLFSHSFENLECLELVGEIVIGVECVEIHEEHGISKRPKLKEGIQLSSVTTHLLGKVIMIKKRRVLLHRLM